MSAAGTKRLGEGRDEDAAAKHPAVKCARQNTGLDGTGAVVGGQGSFLGSQGAGSYEGWLRQTGAWWDEALVEVRAPWRAYSEVDNVPSYLRDGWGLMSRNKKIKKGTVICKVPKEASFCGDAGSSCSEDQDSQLHLAIRLLREQRKGTESTVWPKIATLPGSVPVCWTWTDEERGWLGGSELEVVVRRKIERLHAEFCRDIQPLGEGWTEAEYIDACATIISHANPWWGVSSVAFVDMGNHDDDPHVEFRQKANLVVGTVIKTIPKFSEIYQSYGQLGSADLLYRYGFTREGADAHVPRPQDVVSIDAPLLSSLIHLTKQQATERVGFLHACSVLDESPWDGLEDVLTIQLAPMLHEQDHQHVPSSNTTQAPAQRARMRLSGLSELIVGCLVMTLTDDKWQILKSLHRCANEVLLQTDEALSKQDLEMLALFLALHNLALHTMCPSDKPTHNNGAHETSQSMSKHAPLLLTRLERTGITLGGAAQKPSSLPLAVAAGSDNDSESHSDDDDSNELDWSILVGGQGEELPVLSSSDVLAAARLAVERRIARLGGHIQHGFHEGAVALHTDQAQVLSMARRISQLEHAVLADALAALHDLSTL